MALLGSHPILALIALFGVSWVAQHHQHRDRIARAARAAGNAAGNAAKGACGWVEAQVRKVPWGAVKKVPGLLGRVVGMGFGQQAAFA